MSVSVKKTFKIISYVILYSLLAFAVLVLLFTLTAKRSDYGATEVFGYQLFTVESESMEKNPNCDVSKYDVRSIPMHSLVFVELKPQDTQERQDWYASLKVGDVLSFRYRYAREVTITHRIISITQNSTGGYLIELKGDNASDADKQAIQTINTSLEETSSNFIIGKVTGQSRALGSLLFAVRQPLGLTFIVIVPCVIIILLEIFRIVTVLNEDKRRKLLVEKQQYEDEIEKLRQRVAELEGVASSDIKHSQNEEESK